MKRFLLLPAACCLPAVAKAQASVASDLWRVAAGTLVVPMALSDGGSAPLWTPAVSLLPGERVRVGVEAIHAPSEVGVNGGFIAFSTHAPGLGILSVTYGRLSVSDVAFTETSPEAVGDIPIYNQSVSVGLSGSITQRVTGGVAVRYLSGALGFASRNQLSLDVGAIYTVDHVRFGAATRFFNPTFSGAASAASYSVGGEIGSSRFELWGTEAQLLFRYGVLASGGEGAQQLLSAGFVLGTSFAVDFGASSEHASGDDIWRSRFGIALGTGPFRVQIGRDGGVNGFGATYRFGLTAVFK